MIDVDVLLCEYLVIMYTLEMIIVLFLMVVNLIDIEIIAHSEYNSAGSKSNPGKTSSPDSLCWKESMISTSC